MERRRDTVQPNPGFGSICDRCDNQQSGRLENSSLPCKTVIYRATDVAAPRDWPRDENGRPVNIIVPDLVRYRNQREECSSFNSTESAPASSEVVLYEATR